jgi:hypothetical protein
LEDRVLIVEIDHGRANEMGSALLAEWAAVTDFLELGHASALLSSVTAAGAAAAAANAQPIPEQYSMLISNTPGAFEASQAPGASELLVAAQLVGIAPSAPPDRGFPAYFLYMIDIPPALPTGVELSKLVTNLSWPRGGPPLTYPAFRESINTQVDEETGAIIVDGTRGTLTEHEDFYPLFRYTIQRYINQVPPADDSFQTWFLQKTGFGVGILAPIAGGSRWHTKKRRHKKHTKKSTKKRGTKHLKRSKHRTYRKKSQ